MTRKKVTIGNGEREPGLLRSRIAQMILTRNSRKAVHIPNVYTAFRLIRYPYWADNPRYLERRTLHSSRKITGHARTHWERVRAYQMILREECHVRRHRHR